VFNVALSDSDAKSLGSGLEGALAVEPVGKLAAIWGAVKNQ
jgi:hypothetical protein